MYNCFPCFKITSRGKILTKAQGRVDTLDYWLNRKSLRCYYRKITPHFKESRSGRLKLSEKTASRSEP